MNVRKAVPMSVGALMCAFVAVAWVAGQERDTFPHARHEGLFPSCLGCHQGVASGVTDSIYPQTNACAGCHDGNVVRRVNWTHLTAPPPSNMSFSHPAHFSITGDDSDPQAACSLCHQLPDESGRMAVGPPQPDACLMCHAGNSHLDADRDCLQCHVPLSQATGLSAAAVAAFPRPAWHDTTGFLSSHGPTPERAAATCAVCHARESCTRCHMNGSEVAAIQALPPDPRVAENVAGLPPHYPTPPSHDDARAWRWNHGTTALQSTATCANCHSRSSCATCHAGSLVVLASLPPLSSDDPRGVQIPSTARAQVHPFGFQTRHGIDAAAGGSNCSSCHAQEFCSECHAGASTPSFHPPDFVDRHGTDAYASEVECTSCHSQEVFCRACHGASGLAPRDGRSGAFHDANPFWVVAHGQAARQGLNGCVTCHSQSDCLQCHGALEGPGINPHGPGFDPSRLGDVGRLSCLPCHRSIPGGAP